MTNERAIKIGDLVRVVKSHCASSDAEEYGRTFVVTGISPNNGHWELRCRQCSEIYESPSACAVVTKYDWHPTAWLKRIPPLEELEGVEEWRYITNPKEIA